MRRFRATGRFYVFIAMLLVGLFFIVREFWALDSPEAIVTTASASYTTTMDAIILRDESVSAYEGEGRVEYLVDEGATVSAGENIVDLYAASYITKAFTELETIRGTIRDYYQELLSGIKDPELERLEANVQAQALEMKRLLQGGQIGNLVNVERMLRQTMDERYRYLNANRRENNKLNNYFTQESNIKNSIESLKTTKRADKDGVVSFYLDGYERVLTPQLLGDITPEQIRMVMAGKPLVPKSTSVRMEKDIFKITSTEKWYVVLISNEKGWNPVAGQIFQMQMDDVSGFAFIGTVTEIQKSQGEVVAIVEIAAPLGPMINRRSGRMSIGTHLSGYMVPRAAVTNQNGQTGVWLTDVAGDTFVPVEVLTTDSNAALVEPLTEGALRVGHRVLLK